MTLALSLFLLWLALWILQRVQPEAKQSTKWLVLLILVPLVAYPFVYGPVWWLRGLTGDLSMLSLLLLAAAVYQQLSGNDWLRRQERKPLEAAVVVTGLIFYPLALGYGAMDPYFWGYGNIYFVSMLLALAGVALIRNYRMLATFIMLALLSWNMQLLQSVNLWDYLIDPFIWFFYMGRMLRRLIYG